MGKEATQFKPGVSGNPSGRPKVPDELKKYNGVTPERTRRLFDKYASMSMGQLRALAEDDSISGLEHNIVMSLLDPNKFPFFLDRAVGKVKEVVEQTNISLTPDDMKEYEEVPREALIALVSGDK